MIRLLKNRAIEFKRVNFEPASWPSANLGKWKSGIMTTQTIAAKDKTIACIPHLRKISKPINLPALNKVFAGLESPSILGGNDAKAGGDRYSYWAAGPKEIFEFKTGEKKPFEKLHKTLTKYKMDSRLRGNDKERLLRGNDKGNPLCGKGNLPEGIFCGGWIGYFSYELSRYIEKLPQRAIDDIRMPLIRLCFYDRLIAYDHKEKTTYLTALQIADDPEEPNEKLAALENFLEQSQRLTVTPPCPANIENVDFSQIRCNMDRHYYFSTIEKIKRYIYDGDVYQINFSQRFESDYGAKAVELFGWQNCFNPSPYAAYIDAGSFQIVSASPEMFIAIKDGLISTKPIKGTRPRLNETDSHVKQINEKNFNELVRSEKEQAELNMIIDLERNDLVKICEYGTRKVVQPRTIESYPTVFHAVATIEGRLREDVTFCDCLKAMFPGGSITGAPKIRSMEIIDETEPTARGVYTGSIGFIGPDGSASLNIAIRTIIITKGKAYVQTGGGIVADSDPQAEWNETLVKARALLAGIKSVNSIS